VNFGLLGLMSMDSEARCGVLELERLTKQYENQPSAVRDLTLKVAQGELVALLGPSGCGKTTTLRMIAGLVKPTWGCVRLDGADVTDWPSYRRDMGVVFQSYALFPHLNVHQNIVFGLEMRGFPRADANKMVANALTLVRLEGYEGRRIRELSGGEQQRVALARALAIRPKVLLLDEPLSNLDATLREEMRHEIRDIQQQLQITTIFVTHDQGEALSMADRVVVMNKGRAVQIGSPSDIYENPTDPFIAGFVGRINSFSGKVQDGQPPIALLDIGQVRIQLPRVVVPNRPILIMVRPHRIELRAQTKGEANKSTNVSRNTLTGRVQKVVYVGDFIQYQIKTIGPNLLCEQSTQTRSGAHFLIGDEVVAEWDVNDTFVFDRDEGPNPVRL
jgi:putative spermidine/putrescine transport system ATP-binding protein